MSYRTLCALVFATLAVAACGDSSGGPNTGTLVVRLTDAPFPYSSVSRVDVHVVRIDAKSATVTGAEAENLDGGGWITIATPDRTINLLALRGGVVTDLGAASLATGTYRGFRMVLDVDRSSATLTNGTVLRGNATPGIKFPSAGRTGIKIDLDQPVEITRDSTILVVDFDVGRSFVLRGNDIAVNGLLFKPVLQASARDISGSVSGTVRSDDETGPLRSGVTVELLKTGTAVDDTDASNVLRTTSTDALGAFRFGFVAPGTYALRAIAPEWWLYAPALLPNGVTLAQQQVLTGLLVVLPLR